MPSSTVDHYEPREPHLLEDGFAVPRWYSAEHRRPNGEISYDLVMEDDMAFVEGSYRIGGCDWQVFIISKRLIDEAVMEIRHLGQRRVRASWCRCRNGCG